MNIHDTLKGLDLRVPVYHHETLPDGRLKLYLGNGHQPLFTGADSAGIAGIPSSIMAILKENGFDTAEKIRGASDADLWALAGVGRATLKKIRDATN